MSKFTILLFLPAVFLFTGCYFTEEQIIEVVDEGEGGKWGIDDEGNNLSLCVLYNYEEICFIPWSISPEKFVLSNDSLDDSYYKLIELDFKLREVMEQYGELEPYLDKNSNKVSKSYYLQFIDTSSVDTGSKVIIGIIVAIVLFFVVALFLGKKKGEDGAVSSEEPS